MTEATPPRRRSGLLQERSRRTRQALVRAALDLWASRGFETGIEDTTVEEIVQSAGVTKGTFYFHFARKEQILLEMGWDTADLLYQEAQRCLEVNRPLEEALDRVLTTLSRRIQAAPPAAVARAAAEFRRAPVAELAETGRVSFVDAFGLLFSRAQESGALPTTVSAEEMSQMLEALVMDSVSAWTLQPTDLASALRRRAGLLVAGLGAYAPST